jgi:hypothetical protein
MDDGEQDATARPAHRDRTLHLRVIGALMFLAGLGALFLGPAEMHCFYLFSEGGRFHYEGFGFGSLMFGNIALQVAGYYLIGAVLIVLGYGHYELRRWVRKLTLGLLGLWLLAGIPLLCIVVLMLFSAKDISLGAAWMVVVLLGLSYLVAPWLLVRFYRSRDVRLTLEAQEGDTGWLERIPVSVLTVAFASLLYILALQALILFNGLFPAFGSFVSGLQGIYLLDAAMMSLALLTWGLLRLKPWAWWGSLGYFTALTASSVLTLARSSTQDLLYAANLPPKELEFLGGLQIVGAHIAVLVALPLLATLGLLAFAKRHFQ